MISQEILDTISLLVGTPLWGCNRAAELAMFAFGKKQTTYVNNRIKEVGQFALHVQSSWRLSDANRLVVGSADVFRPPEGKDTANDFDWDKGPNLRDLLLDQLFEHGTTAFVVQSADLTLAGMLRLKLRPDLTLEILPEDSRREEHWRLFQPGHKAPHLVAGVAGVVRFDV